jgi:hypothetical protein
LAVRFKERVHSLLDGISKEKIATSDLKSIAVAAGITTEKYRLLSNQSTENVAYGVVSANLERLRLRESQLQQELDALDKAMVKAGVKAGVIGDVGDIDDRGDRGNMDNKHDIDDSSARGGVQRPVPNGKRAAAKGEGRGSRASLLSSSHRASGTEIQKGHHSVGTKKQEGKGR